MANPVYLRDAIERLAFHWYGPDAVGLTAFMQDELTGEVTLSPETLERQRMRETVRAVMLIALRGGTLQMYSLADDVQKRPVPVGYWHFTGESHISGVSLGLDQASRTFKTGRLHTQGTGDCFLWPDELNDLPVYCEESDLKALMDRVVMESGGKPALVCGGFSLFALALYGDASVVTGSTSGADPDSLVEDDDELLTADGVARFLARLRPDLDQRGSPQDAESLCFQLVRDGRIRMSGPDGGKDCWLQDGSLFDQSGNDVSFDWADALEILVTHSQGSLDLRVLPPDTDKTGFDKAMHFLEWHAERGTLLALCGGNEKKPHKTGAIKAAADYAGINEKTVRNQSVEFLEKHLGKTTPGNKGLC